jgi:hypothetical protein
MAHLLLWWKILGMRTLAEMNFLIYLYLLVGPTLLYLCTYLVVPDMGGSKLNLKDSFLECRRIVFGISTIFWVWVLSFMPLFIGQLAPSGPIFISFILCSLALWWSDNPTVIKLAIVGYALLYITFIALFSMEFGSMAESLTGQ